MKSINLRIACLNVMYSASVVLKEIYICNLLHYNTVHPEYIITYLVLDMAFYALSASTWSHPPKKTACT